MNRRQLLIYKLRTQILLVQRTSIQVILVVRTKYRFGRLGLPDDCEYGSLLLDHMHMHGIISYREGLGTSL